MFLKRKSRAFARGELYAVRSADEIIQRYVEIFRDGDQTENCGNRILFPLAIGVEIDAAGLGKLIKSKIVLF